MILQESLSKRIEGYVKEQQVKKDLSDLNFVVYQAKRTKTVYIKVFTFVGEKKVKLTFRISDHLNSRAKTKLISKNMNFNQIKGKINRMIKDIRAVRYQLLLNSLNEKNESV